MWRRKKEVVLTATTCGKIEDLRLAIEVLTGSRVRIKQLDFNTTCGQVYVDWEGCNIEFEFYHGDKVEFVLSGSFGKDNRYFARFDKHPDHSEVRVINFSTIRDPGKNIWQVGKSATDRWEESFPR